VRSDRIALFVPSLNAAGAERVAVNLGRGMTKAGRTVDFVVPRAVGAFVSHVPREARLVELKTTRVLPSLPALVRYLRREKPTGIISFMDHANIVALWARALGSRSTRVVATVHSTMSSANQKSNNRRSQLLPLLVRAFYPWADAIVAVSQGVADDLVRTTSLPANRLQVIYNPVITSELLAARNAPPPHPWLVPGQPPVVVGAGRLTTAKDFSTLLRAFDHVRRRRSARLLILGEGQERPALEALVSQLGIGEHVQLPGFQPEVYAYMAWAAVFALSSEWEGLPTVLIEALALSRSIVSTDCPSGPREILQQGRLGRLVPVHDPEALGEAIVASLDHPGTRAMDEVLVPYTEQAAVEHYLRAVGSPESFEETHPTIHLRFGESSRNYVDHEGA
jgi:glycosyltransferase involved in cell wall biosynthesis